MDLTSAISAAAVVISTGVGAVKSPEFEVETPIKIQPTTKSQPFTNGAFKRHHHTAAPPPPVLYKECLKNHAASLGGHALDGCGEFMPSPTATATATDPTSLKCAACGCHRNFHRRESEDPISPPTTTLAIEYQPHHRHHPPPPTAAAYHRSPSSASPPPISSSYYPSAPHMLLALSGGIPENAGGGFHHSIPTPSPNSRKRFRTKFSENQKEKMYEFAEKVGWKIQKRDDDLIQEFCSDVGVDRGVLKVWMHNNKNKKDGCRNINGDGDGDADDKINGGEPNAAANGSSSSS